MSGFVATVLLREAYTPSLSGEVGKLLREEATAVQESRSSRHWEVKVGESFLTIDIQPTNPLYGDYDDLLINLNLDYEDVPELIEISAGSRSTDVQENLQQLAQTMAERLGGINAGLL